MARVSLVVPEAATAAQQAAFAEVGASRGGVGNLWRALAHSPEFMRRAGATGAYLRFESILPAALRETVILAVAGRWDCPYEQAHHHPLAARHGLDDATVAALDAGQAPAPGALPPLTAAAVRYAQALTRDGRADAALGEELRAGLGEQGLVELTGLVAYYSMLALILNGLEVDLDADPPLPPG
ncbi:MAG TPA: carboxymuconolactone decarboxylase family protein [Chloroflexota bacterium]|nr:carboxymuconolactone decarboxylase family protein [Chloroflexota bacterium]